MPMAGDPVMPGNLRRAPLVRALLVRAPLVRAPLVRAGVGAAAGECR